MSWAKACQFIIQRGVALWEKCNGACRQNVMLALTTGVQAQGARLWEVRISFHFCNGGVTVTLLLSLIPRHYYYYLHISEHSICSRCLLAFVVATLVHSYGVNSPFSKLPLSNTFLFTLWPTFRSRYVAFKYSC